LRRTRLRSISSLPAVPFGVSRIPTFLPAAMNLHSGCRTRCLVWRGDRFLPTGSSVSCGTNSGAWRWTAFMFFYNSRQLPQSNGSRFTLYRLPRKNEKRIWFADAVRARGGAGLSFWFAGARQLLFSLSAFPRLYWLPLLRIPCARALWCGVERAAAYLPLLQYLPYTPSTHTRNATLRCGWFLGCRSACRTFLRPFS